MTQIQPGLVPSWGQGVLAGNPQKKPQDFSAPLLLQAITILANGPRSQPILLSLGEKIKAGKKLGEAFSELPSTEQTFLRDRVGTRRWNEVLALSEERDPEFFPQALLQLALRLKEEQKVDQAAAFLNLFSQYPFEKDIQRRAESELNAILGKGSFGRRLEFLGGTLVQDATNWRVIAPILGASLVGNLVGTGVLSRLVASPGGSWFSRGLGSRLVSGLAGYAVEVPLYAGLNRALTPHPATALWQDVQGAAVTLGVLRSFHFGGRQAFRHLHGIGDTGAPTRWMGMAKVTRPLLPQASVFLGLVSAHKLEESLGLKDPTGNLVTDTLHSMVTFGLGIRLGHLALGPRFAEFQQKLRVEAEGWGRTQASKGGESSFFSEALREISQPPPSPLVIGPLYLSDLKLALTQGAQGKISPSRAQAEAIRALQDDWARRFERYGVPGQENSFLEFLEGIEGQKGTEIPWLKNYRKSSHAAEAQGIQGIIEEPILKKISKEDPLGFYEIRNALVMLTLVEEQLGLPKGTFFRETSEGGYGFHLPPPEFLLDSSKILRPEAQVDAETVTRLVSDATMKRLARGNRRPLIISPYSQSLHDMEAVHPYAALLHDVYHLLKMTRLSEGNREDFLKFHDALEVTSAPEADRELRKKLLESLMDGNPDPSGEGSHRQLFAAIRDHGTGAFRAEFYRNMIPIFQGTVRGNRILEEFREIVLDKKPDRKKRNPPEEGMLPAGALHAVAWPALLAMGEGEWALVALGMGILAMAVGNGGPSDPKSGEKPLALVKAAPAGPPERPEGSREKNGALQLIKKEIKPRDVGNVLAAAGAAGLAGVTLGPTAALVTGGVMALTTIYQTLRRRDRWDRIWVFLKGDSKGPDLEPLGGGPYRSGNSISPLTPLESERAFELRQEFLNSNLSPLVRQQKLLEYGFYLKRMESSDPEFRRGMISLGQVILNSGVTAPHQEKGLPALHHPGLSEATYGDDWALRREALRVAQEVTQGLPPEDLQVLEFVKILYQGLAHPHVHGFFIDRMDNFMTNQKDPRAVEIFQGLVSNRAHAKNRLRQEFLRIALNYLPELAADSPLATTMMKLLRQAELIALAEEEKGFRENLVRAYVALVPLLRRHQGEMDKTYDVLRGLFAEDLQRAQLSSPAESKSLPAPGPGKDEEFWAESIDPSKPHAPRIRVIAHPPESHEANKIRVETEGDAQLAVPEKDKETGKL